MGIDTEGFGESIDIIEEMRKTVNFVVNDSGGRYLLQMRDGNAKQDPLTWEFFGGGLDGEESLLSAASREMLEELEVSATERDFEELGDLKIDVYGGVQASVLKFKKQLAWGDFKVNEGAGAAFFTKEEALKLNLSTEARLIVEKYW